MAICEYEASQPYEPGSFSVRLLERRILQFVVPRTKFIQIRTSKKRTTCRVAISRISKTDFYSALCQLVELIPLRASAAQTEYPTGRSAMLSSRTFCQMLHVRHATRPLNVVREQTLLIMTCSGTEENFHRQVAILSYMATFIHRWGRTLASNPHGNRVNTTRKS